MGSDRHQLKRMSEQAREALGSTELTALADRRYYTGEEIKACTDAGIVPLVPKVLTSNSRAEGRYDKSDFVYDPPARHLPLPSGRVRDPPLHERREEHGDPQVLDLCLSALRVASQVHDSRVPSHRPMGA